MGEVSALQQMNGKARSWRWGLRAGPTSPTFGVQSLTHRTPRVQQPAAHVHVACGEPRGATRCRAPSRAGRRWRPQAALTQPQERGLRAAAGFLQRGLVFVSHLFAQLFSGHLRDDRVPLPTPTHAPEAEPAAPPQSIPPGTPLSLRYPPVLEEKMCRSNSHQRAGSCGSRGWAPRKRCLHQPGGGGRGRQARPQRQRRPAGLHVSPGDTASPPGPWPWAESLQPTGQKSHPGAC